jgi:hypothetical protein
MVDVSKEKAQKLSKFRILVTSSSMKDLFIHFILCFFEDMEKVWNRQIRSGMAKKIL